MARTILVKDVVATAATQLTDADLEHTTVDALLRYMNDAQRVIAKFLPASCSRVDSIKLKPGTRQSIAFIAAADIKPGDGTAAKDVGGFRLGSLERNMGSDGATPGRAIRIVDQDALDSSDPNWHTKTGPVVLRYTFDPLVPTSFYVTPGVPSTGQVWVETKYLATPDELPIADEVPDDLLFGLDDIYVDDILAYALARAFMKDAEVPGAAALASSNAQIFTNSINVQGLAMTGVNPNLHHLPINPAAPATSR